MSSFRYTRPDRFPPIVKNLIIINVLVFVAQIIMHNQYHLTEILQLNPILSPKLQDILAQSGGFTEADKFRPYQIATHMFAHSAVDPRGNIVLWHILFNMFTLWMFGRVLENVWGGKRFLIFYLACGLG